MQQCGLNVQLKNSQNLIVTDNNYTNANVNLMKLIQILKLILEIIQK